VLARKAFGNADGADPALLAHLHKRGQQPLFDLRVLARVNARSSKFVTHIRLASNRQGNQNATDTSHERDPGTAKNFPLVMCIDLELFFV
jgi:hypothetical protein